MSNIDKPVKANSFTRRNFLFGATKSLATLAVASAGVYAIGSAFKSLDGSMVAGAKWCSCSCIYSPVCGAGYWSYDPEFCGYFGDCSGGCGDSGVMYFNCYSW